MVKLNTDTLEHVAKDIADLETRKLNAVEGFLKEMLEAINTSLLKCKAEPFIFNVYGSYEKTLAFSSRNNRTQSVIFDRLYVGIIGNGGLINTSHEEKYLSMIHGHHFLVSCTKLFQLDIISSQPFKFSTSEHFQEVGNPELYLNSQKNETPSWTLTDIAISTINSELIEKNIWPDRTSDVKTLLIVGKEQTQIFIDSLKDESLPRDIWKKRAIREAIERSPELKQLLLQ